MKAVKTIDVHPEHLIDAERGATLDPTGRARLREHRASCEACAVEATVASDYTLEPDAADRARAARIVAAMFEGDAALAPRPIPARDVVARGEARDRAVWPWLIASVAAHAALLALVIVAVDPAADGPEQPLDPIELALALPVSPGAASAATATPTPLLPSSAERAVTSARPPSRSAHARPERASIERSTAPPPWIETAPARAAPAPIDRARLAALLDPGRVARRSEWIVGAPSERGAPAGLERDEGPNELDLERTLSGGLRAEAATKAHITRERPELRRRTDGSHVYSGPRFAAVVRPDGSVEFQDRAPVETNGFSASGTFDATDAIMGAAGQDPLRAEREWFLRHTEELRHRLEAEHRRNELAAALPRLRGRVVRVWATTRRSPAARRARIFAIWDDIAEDEAGRDARRVVIEAVRELLPAGSEDAFSEEELRRLNESRQSRERFSPY